MALRNPSLFPAQENPIRSDSGKVSITIHREGQNFGPYCLEEIQVFLEQRRVFPADLAWTDRASKWQPVENLLIQESFRQQREAYVEEHSTSKGVRLPHEKALLAASCSMLVVVAGLGMTIFLY